MAILGIDTSCDDTSLAVLDEKGKVLVNLVSSQTQLHAAHGGVVPELAGRSHMENLPVLFEETLQRAGLKTQDIEAVAVTQTPGLIGCLLVGVNFAKGLAYRLGVPLYTVNHLEGHLFSPFVEQEPMFPFLGLVVSGGHTAFYDVDAFDTVRLVGQTVDDAAGECFDKVAKMLDLGYPGGPAIDRLSEAGNENAFVFKTPKVKMGPQYLSFSGLKTAAFQMIQKDQTLKNRLPDFCASIQAAIVDALCLKLKDFLDPNRHKAFALSGGVAMNSLLRARAQAVCDQKRVPFFAASAQMCTDNAAMIAYVAQNKKPAGDVFSTNAAASQKIQARQLNKDVQRAKRQKS